MREVLRMHELGFPNPGRAAIYHNSDYMAKVLQRFEGIANPATLLQVVRDNLRDPLGGLTDYSARLQYLRSLGLYTESAARRVALSKNSADRAQQDAVGHGPGRRRIGTRSSGSSRSSSQSSSALITGGRQLSDRHPKRGSAAEIIDPSTSAGQIAAELTGLFSAHRDVHLA